MNIPTLKPGQTFARSLRMVLGSAPRELAWIGLVNLISGAGPSLSLLLSKIMIDDLSRILQQGAVGDWRGSLRAEPTLLWALGGTLVLRLLADAVGTVDGLLFAALRDRIQGYAQEQVLTKLAMFSDIALFETPDLLNLVQLTEKGIERLQRLAFIVATSLMGIFMAIAAVTLAGSLAWWVPVLLVSVTLPSVWVEIRHRRRSWRREETQAGLIREMDIYARLLRSEDYAKEIRLFSLQQVLLERWRSLFGQFFRGMAQVRQQGAIALAISSLTSGLGAAIPYIYLVLSVLAGQHTLGDIALYTGVIIQLQNSLWMLISNAGDVYDVVLATQPIFQILDLEPDLVDPIHPKAFPTDVFRQVSRETPREVPSLDIQHNQTQNVSPPSSALCPPSSVLSSPSSALHLCHISFHYPGTPRPILRDVSFSVQAGEMVVLVGENGAGKTTLAKLLARLYDPTLGSIEWSSGTERRDLRELSLAELRSQIAVVMQDYARFPASLRDNVGWGYLPKREENAALHTVLAEAGLTGMLQGLNQGLETPLGKELEGGIELSGGQWQRVAIARALLRMGSAELLIFDEPTAALDPKTEQEIYDIFRAIAKGRMAVVISHRLSLARIADRIVVLENGQLIEEGHHDTLIAQGGRYAEMFNRQASHYVA